MTKRRAASLLSAALLAGCASLAEEVDADRDAVSAQLAGRTGAATAELGEEAVAATLSERARALLADGVTVDEAVALSLLCQPRLAAELERLGIARAELRRAALPPNPVAMVSWKFFAGPDEIELSLSQSFLELLFLPARKRLAAAQREQVEARVTEALVHHVFDVRRAHAGALHADARRVRARAAAATAEAGAALMEELHDAGSTQDGPRTRAQIAAVHARDEAEAAEGEVRRAHEELAAAIGLPRDAGPFEAAGPWADSGKSAAALAGAAVSELIDRALEASLALAAQRARVAAAAERAGVDGWEALLQPFELGVAAKHETSGNWGVGPSATIALPLFDRGADADGRAEAELRRELHGAQAIARELAHAVERAVAETRLLAARAQRVREIELPLHARLVQETVQQYNAMQVGAFDVLDARVDELAAAQRAGQLELDAERAALDLAELLAGGAPGRARADAMGDARDEGFGGE